MDSDDLKGGIDWQRAIEQAVSRCYAFLSLVSPAAERSKYVRAEYLLTEELGKPVFPLLIAGDTPWPMATIQVIPLQPDWSAGLQRLLRDSPAAPGLVELLPMAPRPAIDAPCACARR